MKIEEIRDKYNPWYGDRVDRLETKLNEVISHLNGKEGEDSERDEMYYALKNQESYTLHIEMLVSCIKEDINFPQIFDMVKQRCYKSVMYEDKYKSLVKYIETKEKK